MVGTTLGHYRITGELGRGGMGIVYQAEDAKLERTVAIKVLPPGALTNEDDRTRFYREAKAAAQLNHPNIAAIHQIDEAIPEGSPPGTAPSPFIAMEFIDGDSLADRIRDKPMPISDVVRIGKAIASALQLAHEKDIVHRDIKSANVMMTGKGEPKVLDFGLAKTAHSTMLTRMGSTLGTVAYMSPEQARGEEVDGRSDLWSLGVVLYEMVSGRVPFSTDYEQAAVYSILNEDPAPLTGLRTGVPMELERIVLKALAKDAKHRYQTAAGLIADLDALGVKQSTTQLSAAGGTTPYPPSAPPTPHKSQQGRYLVIALALVAMLAVGWWIGRTSTSTGALNSDSTRYTSVILPDLEGISHPNVSPDGRYMAFTTRENRLWLYDFSTGTRRVLDESGGIRLSAFSPDGRWLAYETIGRAISIVQVPDGTPALLTQDAVLPSWIDNEWLLISDGSETGLDRISRVTSNREPITFSGMAEGAQLTHPHPLPGGNRALVTISSGTERQVGLLNLDSGDLTPLIEDGFAASFIDSGHILFSRGSQGDTGFEGDVYAQPFDLGKSQLLGQPIRVLDFRGFWEYGVNRAGDLVTSSGLDAGGEESDRSMFIYRRDDNAIDAKEVELPPAAEFMQLTIDREWMLFVDQDNETIMFGPIEGSRFAPIPNTASPIINAFLSPDDQFVFYTHGQMGRQIAISRQPIDGSSPPEPLNFDLGRHQWLTDVRSENEFLVSHFDDIGATATLTYVNTESGEQFDITSDPGLYFASISPNGRWIAWAAGDPTSTRVFVSDIQGDASWLIAEGFGLPFWSSDGSGLYLRQGQNLVWTAISSSRGIRAEGEFESVFSFDGDGFYSKRKEHEVLLLLDSKISSSRPVQSVDVVLSWGERLKQLAPVD